MAPCPRPDPSTKLLDTPPVLQVHCRCHISCSYLCQHYSLGVCIYSGQRGPGGESSGDDLHGLKAGPNLLLCAGTTLHKLHTGQAAGHTCCMDAHLHDRPLQSDAICMHAPLLSCGEDPCRCGTADTELPAGGAGGPLRRAGSHRPRPDPADSPSAGGALCCVQSEGLPGCPDKGGSMPSKASCIGKGTSSKHGRLCNKVTPATIEDGMSSHYRKYIFGHTFLCFIVGGCKSARDMITSITQLNM